MSSGNRFTLRGVNPLPAVSGMVSNLYLPRYLPMKAFKVQVSILGIIMITHQRSMKS